MSVEKTLIQFILDLLKDPQALADFKDDPQGVLARCGLSDVSTEDVRDALVLAQDDDDSSFDRSYQTGSGHGGGHTPPAPPVEHGENPVEYIDKYVTNNHYTYNVDDRDTIVDNSVNQNIDTGGGDFSQSIETTSVTASGDGAVAAGGDIEDSTITTGKGNVVGDGNDVVTGDHNTASFGDGAATSTGTISADDGSGVSIGGDAEGSNDTSGSFNDTDTTTTTTNEAHDSFNQDYSQDNDVSVTDDSHSQTDLLSHNQADVHVAL